MRTWVGVIGAIVAVAAGCNRGAGAQDAGVAATATGTAAATGTATATAAETATGATATATGVQPLATTGRPMIKLPDGGLAPAPMPEGGAFALPSGFTLPPMPSGMPSTITIPTSIQVPSAIPTTLPSAWPPPK